MAMFHYDILTGTRGHNKDVLSRAPARVRGRQPPTIDDLQSKLSVNLSMASIQSCIEDNYGPLCHAEWNPWPRQ